MAAARKPTFDPEAGDAVQTIARTTVLGVVGYRRTCLSCGSLSGHDTEREALAAAKRHGRHVHGASD